MINHCYSVYPISFFPDSLRHLTLSQIKSLTEAEREKCVGALAEHYHVESHIHNFIKWAKKYRSARMQEHLPVLTETDAISLIQQYEYAIHCIHALTQDFYLKPSVHHSEVLYKWDIWVYSLWAKLGVENAKAPAIAGLFKKGVVGIAFSYTTSLELLRLTLIELLEKYGINYNENFCLRVNPLEPDYLKNYLRLDLVDIPNEIAIYNKTYFAALLAYFNREQILETLESVMIRHSQKEYQVAALIPLVPRETYFRVEMLRDLLVTCELMANLLFGYGIQRTDTPILPRHCRLWHNEALTYEIEHDRTNTFNIWDQENFNTVYTRIIKTNANFRESDRFTQYFTDLSQNLFDQCLQYWEANKNCDAVNGEPKYE